MVQSFISETLDDILKTIKSFEDVVIILPSQRAKVFVKQQLKEKISLGFLPQILNIEAFISEISELEKAENIELLFYFYSIYKKVEEAPVSFDVFCSWAFTVLQDFNEIDQHLINTKDIFVYLRDIQRLKKWSVTGTFQETELIKDHFIFIEKLQKYYNAFYSFLLKKNTGYQGLLYREASKKIALYLEKTKHKKFFFIGFNALNKAEEYIFKKVLETGNSDIYWDIDASFFNSNHQASAFIRKYKTEWKYYEKNVLKILGNSFSEPKNIQVIGASKNITQIKYAAEILEKFTEFTNTALVLADESLLPVALSSLPKNINAINITMGYPLKDVPITSLFLSVFKLFLSQQKLQKTAANEFYYKDVVRFLKHPSIYKVIPDIDAFFSEIANQNKTFISYYQIKEFFKNNNTSLYTAVLLIFDTYTNVEKFIDKILTLIEVLKEALTPLEKEYLFRFFTIFTQLKALHKEYAFFEDLKTVELFFTQLISSENLSFQGEPLKGLQLMGMLETRVLDFENIILISTNEGILPSNTLQNSFVPFDVKIAFGLPTYKEKDAIFSYHFFRLLQRATTIFIIYNTEHDVFGSGEKSRFITQLEMMRTDVVQKIITPKIITNNIDLKEVAKTPAILDTLKDIAKTGISPSALTLYLHNPIAFYKQRILKLKEYKEVEETVAFNTLGTVVHETLNELYTPFIGAFLQVNDLAKMKQKTKELVIKHFAIHFKKGDIFTGKNRLIFEVANRFVINFLSAEIKLIAEPTNQLKILATEQNLATEITIEGIDFPIKIYGQVDRVDELNGVLRIIDYKTGIVSKTNLKVLNFNNLRDEKYLKAVQVLLYAYIYTKTKKHNFLQPLEAGIYSFKNLKSGFLPVDFSSNYRQPNTQITQEKLEQFIVEIKTYIKEIYSLNTGFIEPDNLKY